MKDRLPSLFVAVYHYPVTPFGNAKLSSKLIHHQVDMPDKVFILLGELKEGGNMLLWNDKYVVRSLRVDIMKGKHLIIFINDFGWNFFVCNTAKNTAHASPPFSKLRFILRSIFI
jgi:hypothetical protein